MAKQFTQLRYVGEAGENLTFLGDKNEQLDWSNNIINEKYVTQLGIYALPGTEFLLNQAKQPHGEQLVINNTGIFQIDVEDRPITSLRIGKDSYEKLQKETGHYIIIDVVYEGGVLNG